MTDKQALYKRIDRWLDDHRDELVRDICRMVSIRSVSQPGEGGAPFGTGCRAALHEMLKLGEEQGFSTRNFEDRCGCLWLEEPEGRETLGFWGHLDVVPEGSGWLHAPYEPVEEDGWLIGRGVADNKGPTVGTLYLLRCLKELGIRLSFLPLLFVGCDEERGMEDLAYYTSRYPCPEMSIIADSGFPVCYGEKGILEGWIETPSFSGGILRELTGGVASNMVPDRARAVLQKTDAVLAWAAGLPAEYKTEEDEAALTVCAFGISRHSAAPEGGVNAIGKLTRILSESGLFTGAEQQALLFLTRINDTTDGAALGIPFSDEVSGALTCVGSRVSTEPDGRLRLGLNIRYPITADAAALQCSMAERAAEAGCAFLLERDSAPNYFPKEHPAVELLTNLFNRETGQQRQPFVMGGGTYARKLERAFAYGPGGVPQPEPPEGLFPAGHGGGHEPDEGLCIDGLIASLKLYGRALLELDGLQLAPQRTGDEVWRQVLHP